MINRIDETHSSNSRKEFRSCIIEISTNTTCDSKKKIIEKKNSKTIVNLTFCDDFCKRFDQFEFAKCENHDYNDFSNHFDATQTTMQKLNQKTMFYRKSSAEENISYSNDFQKEIKNSIDF